MTPEDEFNESLAKKIYEGFLKSISSLPAAIGIDEQAVRDKGMELQWQTSLAMAMTRVLAVYYLTARDVSTFLVTPQLLENLKKTLDKDKPVENLNDKIWGDIFKELGGDPKQNPQ